MILAVNQERRRLDGKLRGMRKPMQHYHRLLKALYELLQNKKPTWLSDGELLELRRFVEQANGRGAHLNISELFC
jgi:hypothetical protein